MRRTALLKEHSLGIVHGGAAQVFWPPAEALAAGFENSQCQLKLCLCDPFDDEAADILDVDIYTPQGVLDEWSVFLSPPVTPDLRPPFTLDEMERVRMSTPGTVSAKLVSLDPMDAMELGMEPERSLQILVNEGYLDTAVILAAISQALEIVDPDLARRYPMTWEHEIPEGYGDALLTHFRLQNSIYEASSRQAYVEARAVADAFWRDFLLPLEADVQHSRLLQVPEYVIEAQERACYQEDQELFGDNPFGASLPALSIASRSMDPDPVEEEIHRTTADSPGLYDLISSLKHWQIVYPELNVLRALEWLDRYRSPPSQTGKSKPTTRS